MKHILTTIFSLAVLLPIPATAQDILITGSGGGTSIRNYAPPAATGPYKLTGTVVNSVTGEPIRRSLVQLLGPGGFPMLTDESGSFSYENLAAGIYSIMAMRPGYLGGFRRSGSPTTVEVGPNSPGTVKLRLIPQSVIEGQVVGDHGEPQENATVIATGALVQNGRRRWMDQHATQTDSEGRYRIADLKSGGYYVKVQPSRARIALPPSDQEPAKGYAPTYFPAALDRASAALVQVGMGEQATADFRLPRTKLYRVSGVMRPVGRFASVSINNTEGYAIGGAPIDTSTGHFEVDGVPSGTYRISGWTQLDEKTGLRADATVTITSNRDDIILTPQPIRRIPVHVRVEHGGGAREQTVSRTGTYDLFNIMNGAVQLVPLDEGGGYAMATVRNDGGERELGIENAAAGAYQVEFNLGLFWIQSAESGGKDLLREPFVVSDSGRAEPIDLVLRDDPAMLSVRLKNQSNIGHATVLVIPDHGGRPKVLNIGGSQGTLQTAPGEYLVFATSDNEELEYMNPDVLRPYLSAATHVTLTAGKTTDLQLEAIAPSE